MNPSYEELLKQVDILKNNMAQKEIQIMNLNVVISGLKNQVTTYRIDNAIMASKIKEYEQK